MCMLLVQLFYSLILSGDQLAAFLPLTPYAFMVPRHMVVLI